MEVGWRQALGNFALTPFAAVETLRFRELSFAETAATGGADLLALAIPRQSINSLPLAFGLKGGGNLSLGQVSLTPHVQLSYVRELDDHRQLAAAFAAAPATRLVVEGVSPGRDYGHIGAGVVAHFSRGMRLFADAGTDRAAHSHADAVSGGIAWSW